MRTLLLLLGAVLATVCAQSDELTAPHVLFTPQSYHVGATESFSFTSYSQENFEVTATLTYNRCTCAARRRNCRDRGDVLTRATGSARQGRPVVLDLRMPGLNELQGRDYYVSVTSHNGSVVYLSRRRMFFSGDAFGFLLLKTDKPIYKPAQQVNFCIVYVDKSLRPFNSDAVHAEVTVRDAKSKQIIKWDAVKLEAGGFTCLDFPLSEEPNLGTWSIQANIRVPDEVGGCRVFYSTPSASCSFKVDEFVLPKFEVTLEGPSQITRDEARINGKVSAKYTFGEYVQGVVRLNATLESRQRGETLLFYERTTELRGGRRDFAVNANLYRSRVRYRYDPFCVRSQIRITAEVEEEGRGAIQSDSIVIPLVNNDISVEFADGNPKFFRPGLNYTARALAKLGDGTPAVGEPVRLRVTANNDEIVLFDDEVSSNSADGLIQVPIPVPITTNCLKLVLSPAQLSPSCGEKRVCFSPSPIYSPTRSFLQLEDVSGSSPIEVGSLLQIQATSTIPFVYLHLLVISQGSIQEHSLEVERSGTTSAIISIRVTYDMVPSAKILGVFARTDGELVADLIEVPVVCKFENTVDLSFNRTSAAPGDAINLRVATEGSPDSVVLVSVIDKSLTLLAEACKSLEDSNVCRLLKALTRGSLSGGASCSVDRGDLCCPLVCSEPTKNSVRNFFTAAGVSIQSNMFQPTAPVVPRPRIPYYPYDFRVPDIVGPPGRPEIGIPEVPDDRDDGGEEEEEEEEGEARTFFPESWIWSFVRTDRQGEASLESTVPDTITSWVGEAIALHPSTGLGISRQTELIVSKPFFVSLELPFSVNFGEMVTIIPLVFNFGRGSETLQATVTVEVDSDLDIVETTLPDSGILDVPRGRGTPFTLKLRPRAIGLLPITIAAVEDSGKTDIVRKLLFVKPGCDELQRTENVFAEDNGRVCFNYTLPDCVIPGSASAIISATGDIMSPPNLDRLLVLPSGCGEQTLVRTSTNWVVAEYLSATNQLSDFIAVKIKNNIQTGYQRQLTFLQTAGCFSVWSQGSCSLWLTAAVVNAFSGIVDFYREQEPGTELIDEAVINGAVSYILNNQDRSGRLPIIGRVHNSGLMRDDGFVAHTAFGVVSLKEYLQVFGEDTDVQVTVTMARDAVTRAEQYIQRQYEDTTVEICNYGLALATYSLFKEPTQRSTAAPQAMLRDLRSRIRESSAYPGTCFLCNACPSDEDEMEEGEDCVGRPKAEGSAACVETTAYALLALRAAGDTRSSVCLARWLVRIRSGNGGYWSSQDTVVALQALAGFTEDTFTNEIDMTVTFDLTGLSSPVTRAITSENRFDRFDVEVPSVPSNGNCVSWAGTGTAILQSVLEYHGCNCCEDVRAFSLELASKKDTSPLSTTLDLFVRIRYLEGKLSNMAIVDVEIPSGYDHVGWRFENEIAANADVERVDVRGSNAIFYFNEVPSSSHTTFIVEFIEKFEVENSQQLPVTIYDYYDPGKTVTKYYLPETSPPLPPLPTATGRG